MARRAWWLVLLASVALGLVSLASNITSEAQLSGDADTFLTARFTISKLVNSGTAWAGLPILAGWLVGRRGRAAVAGIAAGLTALVTHYGVGLVFGQFDPLAWVDNSYWFVIALIVGAPLGLIGSAARRTDRWGLLASLTVPLGAILEPFYVGLFTPPAMIPTPDRVSSALTGALLLIGGVVGAIAVLRRRHRRRRLAACSASVRPGRVEP